MTIWLFFLNPVTIVDGLRPDIVSSINELLLKGRGHGHFHIAFLVPMFSLGGA